MKFRGQIRVLKEISYLLPRILDGKNMNIMLIAPSGYGKTTLGEWMLTQVDRDGKNSSICRPKEWNFNTRKRFIFVDEAHELPMPESLYSYMDSGNYVFIIASNETGSIREPLVNRCVPLIFDKYELAEIKEIVKDTFAVTMPEYIIDWVANRSKLNPRVAKKNLVERLENIFAMEGIPSEERLDQLSLTVLGIDAKGLNPTDKLYLVTLTKLGKASLELVSRASGIDKATIIRDVEPFLIMNGWVTISSRGRSVVPSLDDLF